MNGGYQEKNVEERDEKKMWTNKYEWKRRVWWDLYSEWEWKLMSEEICHFWMDLQIKSKFVAYICYAEMVSKTWPSYRWHILIYSDQWSHKTPFS